MAYKPYLKKDNGNIVEVPVSADSAMKDGNGNVIHSTYSTKTELNTLSSRVSTKADLNNSSQSITAGTMAATNGNFTNINNQLATKVEFAGFGTVSMTSKMTVNGWYIRRKFIDNGTAKYEFEIVFPNFNISNFINQNADTNVTITGLPAYNSLPVEPIVVVTQAWPGPTNDYMNSQCGKYVSASGSGGSLTIALRRAYSEGYTYVTILIKGIMT